MKPILGRLKKHPDGVDPVKLNKEFKGINMCVPRDVGVAMKESNTIVYRMELGKYQLISRAHATALETINDWNDM